MLSQFKTYQEMYRNFQWNIPNHYNIGVDVCDRHANGSGRLALIAADENGEVCRYSFDDIRRLSNGFANALTAVGLKKGDRIAVLLPQSLEIAITHIAVFKAGLISVPLFTLFGEDALEYRMVNSGAKAIITDPTGYEKIRLIRDRLPELRHVYITGAEKCDPTNERFDSVIGRGSDSFTPVETLADDPSTIIYTSGTTGNPKGALLRHSALLGHLPCVELSHDLFPRSGDLFWTPADWAWIGGLFDVLLPAWHYGVPVLAHRARKFDPEQAMHIMAVHNVRNTFLPPTALKLMRLANASPHGVRLRTIASGGETLGQELFEWGRQTFGLSVNEFYGQTECNLIACNSATIFPVRLGSFGRPVPGHQIRVVSDDGRDLRRGEVGNIAIRRGNDPVMFMNYWNDPATTNAKFKGDLLITGDLAYQDEDDYFWFIGRSDDIITSAGYRIGPGEIEDCLLKHPAVAIAAVAGVPDPIRTEIVKAWIVLRNGFAGSESLAVEIQEFVKVRLAAHEYPRQVVFVRQLPMTSTGKIIRNQLRIPS